MPATSTHSMLSSSSLYDAAWLPDIISKRLQRRGIQQADLYLHSAVELTVNSSVTATAGHSNTLPATLANITRDITPAIHHISFLRNLHFTSITIDGRNPHQLPSIYYFDPFGAQMSAEVKTQLIAWLQTNYPTFPPGAIATQIISNSQRVQHNGYDCGPLNVNYAERFLPALQASAVGSRLNPSDHCQAVNRIAMAQQRIQDASDIRAAFKPQYGLTEPVHDIPQVSKELQQAATAPNSPVSNASSKSAVTVSKADMMVNVLLDHSAKIGEKVIAEVIEQIAEQQQMPERVISKLLNSLSPETRRHIQQDLSNALQAQANAHSQTACLFTPKALMPSGPSAIPTI